MLAKLGNKLQRISHQYNLCVVCVNQVRVCSRKNDHDEKKKNKRKNTQPNLAFYFRSWRSLANLENQKGTTEIAILI